MAKAVTAAWAAACVAAVCWPFLLPGQFLWRDMVVLDHPALSPAAFGSGDLPARAVPQDALLALVGAVGSAAVFVRALMLCSCAAAAAAAWKMSHRGIGRAAAIALAVANPFVVERLLQGQWSLALAAWLLPVIFAAGVAGRHRLSWLALFAASLTPSGALTGLTVAVGANRGARVRTAGLGALLVAPWAIPGLVGSGLSDAASAAAFAPRAESHVGTLGALLGLGGIWNGAAVPDSRAAGFALFGLGLAALVACGAARLKRRILVPAATLAALGMGGAVACWLCPDAVAWLMASVPGAGLIRDSQKLIMLAIPLYVAAIGQLRGAQSVAALACVVLQTPDVAASLAAVRPVTAPVVDEQLVAELAGREVLFVDRGPLVDVPGGVAVDPYLKATAAVAPGQLVVDGAQVDPPSPRWLAAQDAWRRHDLGELERLGVGAVVESGHIVAETGVAPPRLPWAPMALWLAAPLMIVVLRRGRDE